MRYKYAAACKIKKRGNGRFLIGCSRYHGICNAGKPDNFIGYIPFRIHKSGKSAHDLAVFYLYGGYFNYSVAL